MFASEDTSESVSPKRNLLLTDLPADEAGQIDEASDLVAVKSKQRFFEPHQRITHVFFPEDAVVSLVTVLHEGLPIEAMTVGNDGFTGLPLLNGVSTTTLQMIGQIPGSARRIRAQAFIQILKECPELKLRLSKYSQLVIETVSQSAACNRVHVVEERCARWLLMSRDRVGRDEFQLTQGFVSQMLGVRRPAVTVAMGVLTRAGLIAHHRGVITILDPQNLERASCECYAIIKSRQRALFARRGRSALEVAGPRSQARLEKGDASAAFLRNG